MKNLTKLTLSVVGALALSSSSVSADIVKNISVGVTQVEVFEESATGFSVGYGFATDTLESSGLYWGFGFNFDMASLGEEAQFGGESVMAYGGNVKLGYAPINKLGLYVMGSVMMQSIGNASGAGFGYGAGAEYRVAEHFAVDVEYKTHSMSLEGLLDYDYNTVGANIKYIF